MNDRKGGQMMLRKRVIIGVVLAVALALQIGCTAQPPGNVEDNNVNIQEDAQRGIMEEFDQLTDSGAGLFEIIEFIDQNIAQLSKENASIMVDRLESLQKDNLPKLEERYYSDQQIQAELFKSFKPGAGIDMNEVDKVSHKGLLDLLIETRDTGYRVETAEGMYFPIIDYGFYKKYSDYVTDDMKEYIEIMAIESEQVPAKDAALVIKWGQVVERALRQDKFLQDYPASIKADAMKELYGKYVMFTLFGLNNTPLFDYNTKAIREDAKAAYMQAADSGDDQGYTGLLKGYLEVLEQNGWKLTDEVDRYRKGIQ
jgi:hypothetical protein